MKSSKWQGEERQQRREVLTHLRQTRRMMSDVPFLRRSP
jgi:hypothetical protein